MLSRRQQAHNWAKPLSWAALSNLSLEGMMLILYSKQLWRNNNIIGRSETSLEAILSTKLAGRSPQSLKENDWEQKSMKREEPSDLLFSAIFINFVRGTSPCHGSLTLYGESCFCPYKEALPSLRAVSAKVRVQKSSVFGKLCFALASALLSIFLPCKINGMFTDAQ